MGNWSDVADHVGTKSKQKCEQHYYDVYLNSTTAPLPDLGRPMLSKDRAKPKVEEKAGEKVMGAVVAHTLATAMADVVIRHQLVTKDRPSQRARARRRQNRRPN